MKQTQRVGRFAAVRQKRWWLVGLAVVAALIFVAAAIGKSRTRRATATEPTSPAPALRSGVTRPSVDAEGRVMARGGAGIAGAVVAFAEPGRGDRDAMHVVVAGADGSWRASLPRGTYLVIGSAVGFVTATRTVELGLDPASPALAVVNDPVELVLDRGGVMLSGTVDDLAGGPIAGARVELLDHDGARSGLAVTDAAGRYAMPAQVGHLLTAVIRADGYARAVRRVDIPRGVAATTADFTLVMAGAIRGTVVRSDGAPCRDVQVHAVVERKNRRQERSVVGDEAGAFTLDALEPGEVTLTATGPGCATEGDTRLELAPGANVDDVRLTAGRAFAITGVVVARGGGAPIAGAHLMLSTDMIRPMSTSTAISDRDGRFAIEGVARGSYFVEATSDAHMFEVREGVVVADADAAVRLEMSRGRTIRGRVDPPAVADLKLELARVSRADPSSRREMAVRAASDASGEFVVRGVPDGEYKLAATAADGRRGTVTLAAAGDVEGARIALAGWGDAALDASVVDEDGAPVAGIVVDVQHPPWLAGTRHLATSVDGTFRADQLPRGEVAVTFHGREPVDHAGTKLDLGPGVNRLRFIVRSQDRTIRGTVLGPDGRPGRDIWVDATMPNTSVAATAMTDANGNFVLRNLTRTAHALFADSSSGDLHASLDEAPVGEPVVLRLERRDHLVVRVSRHGAPVRDYRLSCKVGNRTSWQRVQRADGVFHAEPMERGSSATCSVSTHDGHATGTTEIPAPLELALEPWSQVTGRLVDDRDAPLANTAVTFLRGAAAPDADANMDIVRDYARTVTTDATGRFTFDAMPGPAWLAVRGPDRKLLASRSITIGATSVDTGPITIK